MTAGISTGSEQEDNRPAVIVSNDVGNQHAPVVEIVYITTQKKAEMPTHVYVESAELPSMALCEQIVTVCKSRLERYVGSVAAEEMREIDRALAVSLGIHEIGGDNMQITMITTFGKMEFDMPQERVTALMQLAFRYAAGQEKQPEEQPETIQQPVRPMSRVDTTDEPAPLEPTPPDGYKGFLLIKCTHCGSVKGFCTKSLLTQYVCECGERMELQALKPAYVNCVKCGSTFKYMTNMDSDVIDYECLQCGSPIDLQLNKRRDTYVTICDR